MRWGCIGVAGAEQKKAPPGSARLEMGENNDYLLAG